MDGAIHIWRERAVGSDDGGQSTNFCFCCFEQFGMICGEEIRIERDGRLAGGCPASRENRRLWPQE